MSLIDELVRSMVDLSMWVGLTDRVDREISHRVPVRGWMVGAGLAHADVTFPVDSRWDSIAGFALAASEVGGDTKVVHFTEGIDRAVPGDKIHLAVWMELDG